MRRFTILGVAVALALGVVFAPFASSSPDGLERVAADRGFVDRGRPAAGQERSPAPGYAFPGVHDPRLATALSGLAGTLAVFALAGGLALAVRRRAGAVRSA
jgi:hypothetical protein